MECHLLTNKVYTMKSDTVIIVPHYKEFKAELATYSMLNSITILFVVCTVHYGIYILFTHQQMHFY